MVKRNITYPDDLAEESIERYEKLLLKYEKWRIDLEKRRKRSGFYKKQKTLDNKRPEPVPMFEAVNIRPFMYGSEFGEERIDRNFFVDCYVKNVFFRCGIAFDINDARVLEVYRYVSSLIYRFDSEIGIFGRLHNHRRVKILDDAEITPTQTILIV